MLRYSTAGESHGKALIAVVDGFPAGMPIDESLIDAELRRRQGGYGRGGRQRIETDHAEILSGVWRGETIGSPVALQIINKDHKLERLDDLTRPRPGHGDLTGAIKHLGSIRGILERASARETAARVAAGAFARQLLALFDIQIVGYVVELGGLAAERQTDDVAQFLALRDQSIIYSLRPDLDDQFRELIDATGKDGDTLGGVVEVQAWGLPFGLGTHTQWDQKLDGRLAQAVMSVQAIKGVEIGMGFEAARRKGSRVHDPIQYDPNQQSSSNLGYTRPTNAAGGLEAGMTNAQPLVVRAAMKPISTLRKPLESISLVTKQPEEAEYERSDVCAVPAASVIVENVVAFELARAFTDKFGHDSVIEIRQRYDAFCELARRR